MGVKWLTSYVRDVQSIVSSQVVFESNNDKQKSTRRPAFIVDAWALIYQLWLVEYGDSIRELDYQLYQDGLVAILDAWVSFGASVTMVFDGPMLPSKGPTDIARRSSIAASNAAYMKSSVSSRISRRFQRECGLIPPLLLYAFIDAIRLRCKEVEMVFAPTEADSLVAELATEKDQGYALSLDSDYFILCARGKGCNYVPLDSIEYLVEIPTPEIPSAEAVLNQAPEEEENGFQAVGRRRRGGGRRFEGASISKQPFSQSSRQNVSTPPAKDSQIKLKAMSLRAYRPHDLAAHLHIPPTLLPVLAALVGNDYTTSLQSSILFRQLQGPRRISEAAIILRNEWIRVTNESKMGLREATKAASNTRRGHARLQMTTSVNDNIDDEKGDSFSSPSSATATPTRSTPGPNRSATPINVQDPVLSLVRSIVEKSINQTDAAIPNSRYVSTGERELIVESIIDSVATYSLLTHSNAPHLASPSALFFGHPSSIVTTDTSETIASLEALERYKKAYLQGLFRETLIEAMTQRVILTMQFAEDPDVKSVQVTLARELRHWLWAILFEVWGMSWARKEWDEPRVQIEDVNEEKGEEEINGMANSLARLDKGYKEGEKPDDVISVDTESSHSIAHGDDNGIDDPDELPSRPGSVAEMRRGIKKPPPGIIEYVRKGHTLSSELIQILPLVDLLNGAATEGKSSRRQELPPSLAQLRGQHEASQVRPESSLNNEPSSDPVPPPIVLMSLSIRLDLYMHAHRSCTPKMMALPQSWWPIASILRLSIAHEVAQLHVSKKKGNWSRGEIIAAIQSAFPTSSSRSKAMELIREIQPSTRAIHLASTIQLLLKTSYFLSQSLLIPSDIPNWSLPHTLYHGPTFHYKMAGVESDAVNVENSLTKEERSVLKAVIDGLEGELAIDASELRKERKAKKKEANAQEKEVVKIEPFTSLKANGKGRQAARNAFAALQDSFE